VGNMRSDSLSEVNKQQIEWKCRKEEREREREREIFKLFLTIRRLTVAAARDRKSVGT
jgi:hypothetical protein